MAGLLGDGWDDPKSAAIMAFAGGLLRGDFGGGLLGANQAFQEHGDRKLKRGLLEAQIEETKAQAAERKASMEKAQQLAQWRQAELARLDAPSQPAIPGGPSGGLGSGTFGVNMPGQPSPQNDVASELKRLERNVILGMPGAKESLEIFKFRNTPQAVQAGGYSRHPVTGEMTYNADPTKGMTLGKNGIEEIPNYMQFIARQKLAENAPQAALNSMGRVNLRPQSDGTQRPVSEWDENATMRGALGDIFGGRQSAPQIPQAFRPQSQRIEPEQQRGMDAEAIRMIQSELQNPNLPPDQRAGLQREIQRLTVAQSQPGFPTPTLKVSPGIGYGKTTAQQTAEEVQKVRDTKTAEADVGRESVRAKDVKTAQQFLSVANRAEEVLKEGPTASGFGSAVDSAAGFFGYSTDGAASAQKLKALGGWLVANVPRMEGPQSNFDVGNYQAMAADVGNDKLPLERRQAALDGIKAMMQDVVNGTTSKPATPKARAGAFTDAAKEQRYQEWKRSQR